MGVLYKWDFKLACMDGGHNKRVGVCKSAKKLTGTSEYVNGALSNWGGGLRMGITKLAGVCEWGIVKLGVGGCKCDIVKLGGQNSI